MDIKTEEEICPDNTYHMSGNEISVKTLDLSENFDKIKIQLNAIIYEYFGEESTNNAAIKIIK